MKSLKILSLSIAACFILTSALHADTHTEGEVQELIKAVELKFDKYADTPSLGREIAIIERYIKQAKKFLGDNDRDIAFYEISKADAYFNLIEAKKIRMASENEYKEALKRFKESEKK